MNPAWRHARAILCVRLGSLGSVLLCTPALRALRDGLPGRRLTLLTSPSGAAAVPFLPDVDDVIVRHAQGPRRGERCHPQPQPQPHPHSQPGDARAHAHADAALVAQLAARRFDAAVVFTSHAESALSAARLCRLAGIPLRLAHAADPAHDAGDDARHALTDPVPDPESGGAVRHDAMRQIGLIRHLGCSTRNLALSFAPRPDDLEGAHTALLRLGLAPGQPCVLLHPGAGAPAHRYPPALWAAVARGLADATGLPLLFTGSRADVALVDAIRAGCGVATRSLAGELDLGQLGALIRMAALLVCASTGPAQIAAAVGTPLVAPYALTHPQRTPWQVRSRVLLHDVPCRFCHADTCPLGHHACLAHIAPGRIVDAAIDLVSNRPAAPRS